MSSFSGFDMSVLGSVLAAQFGYAPGASTPAAGASRTATNRPLSAAELSKLPPWDSRQPKVAQAIEVSRILAAKSILDPGAASLKNGRLSVESDIKKLFTVHKAMDRLQTLSEAAARNGISGSEKNRITDRFNRGLKELDEFMTRMKMHKVDLIKGRRNDKLETEQFKAAAGVLQGQNLDVSGPTVAVADFANAPPFDMTVTTEAGATTLTFDFDEMGTTVRSLDNVAGYMNSKLAAEGFSTRVRSEYKLDMNTGTYGWGLTIQRATGEDISFPGSPGSSGPVPGGNLIVNGDFRDNPLPSTAPYGDLGSLNGWTSNNDFELFNVGERGWAIDTDIAYAATPDEQSQSVQTEAGKLYDLTFDYKTAQDSWTPTTDDFDVLWNGNVVGTFSPDGKVNWLGGKVQVTGTGGMDTLTFREKGENDAGGSLVANVRLQEAMGTSPPPPPPTGPAAGVDVLGGAGRFENPNLTNSIQRLNSFEGWSATGAGAFLIDGTGQNGLGMDPAGQLVELSGPNQVLSRSVNTVAGQNYRLSLDFSAGDSGVVADARFEVLWNGQVVGTFNPADADWETRQLNVTGTGGADTLAFRSLNTTGSSNDGAWIDNVKLEGNATPTGANLVSNGSFESGTSGWITSGGVGFVNDPSRASDGTSTTIMSSSNNGAGWSLSTNVSGTTAGQAYALEFDYGSFGTVGSGPESGVRAIVKDAGGNVLASQDFYDSTQQITGAGIYQKGRMDFGATGSNVTVEFVDINSGNAITDSMMLDNVSVRSIPAPVSPPPPPPPTNLLAGKGDFANPDLGQNSFTHFTGSAGGWTTTNRIEIQQNGSGGAGTGASDDQYMELDGDISTTMQTQAGQAYNVAFDFMKGNDGAAIDQQFEVVFNGNVVGTFDGNNVNSWQDGSVSVTGTGGTDTLTFRKVNGTTPWEGAFIDSVTMTAAGASPPPPPPPPASGTYAPSGPTGTVNATAASMNNYRTNPTIAALADGGTVVAWQEGSWATQWTGKFQRYDATGNKVGAETSFGQGGSPEAAISVAGLTGGGFVVGYQTNFNNPTNGWDLRMQRYDANGNAAGGATQIGSGSEAGDQIAPTITALADGGFAVAWDQRDTAGSGTYDINARFFNADGTARSNSRATEIDPLDNETGSNITQLSDGRVLVSWTEDGVLAGRFYDAQGDNGSTQINFTTPGSTASTYWNVDNLTATSDGGVVFTWTDGATGSSWAQKFDGAGQNVGELVHIAHSGQTGQASSVSVEATSDGGYVLAYRANEFNNTNGIFARTFDSNGTAVGDVARLSQNANAEAPNLVKQANGDIVAVWQEGGGNDVGTSIKRVNLTAGGAPGPNLLTNGSFEADNVATGDYIYLTAPQGWTASNPGVNEVADTWNGVPGTDGTQWIEFSSNTLSQSVTTQAGQAYTFAFDYRKGDVGTGDQQRFRVRVNGQLLDQVDANGVNNWANASYTFIGSGNDTVQFERLSGGVDTGVWLDNVEVRAQASSPPPPPTVGPNIVTNGSFEADNVATGGYVYLTAPSGWTASNPGVNEVADTWAGVPGTDGTQWIEFSSNTLSQALTTQAGQNYTFSFDYRKGDVGTGDQQRFRVRVNGQLLDQVDANGVNNWASKAYTFTASGNDTIQFERLSGGIDTGVWFDNVQVRAQASPPPPPPPPPSPGLGANLVTNGGFEADDIPTQSFAFLNVTGWTGITGSQGELKDYANAQEGSQYMELMNGGTRQSINTEAGKVYQLDFKSREGGDGTPESHAFEVWYNGAMVADIAPVPGQGWRDNTFTFTGAGGPANLEFRMKPGQENAQGSIIDAVQVREVIGTSPPPPAAPGTNVLLNGSFEGTDVANNSSADVQQAGWTTVLGTNGGRVDTLDYNGAPDGEQYAELDQGGGYKTTLNTEAGRSYTLDFDFKNNVNGTVADNQFEVWWNGQKVGDYGPGAGQDWTNGQITVTGTGNPTALEFRTKTNTTGMPNFNGAQIDDVRVIAGPLPGSAPPSADIASRTYGTSLIQDGGFEGLTAGFTSSLGSSPWQSTTGMAEVINPAMEGPGGKTFLNGGQRFVELDMGMAQDDLFQDVQTEAGKTYQLDFNMAGRGNQTAVSNTLEVLWNDRVVGTATVDATGNWTTTRLDVVGTGGTDRLTFRETAGGNDSEGPFIDNVRLREVTNAPVDNPNDGPGILGMTGANWGTGGSMRVVDMTSAKAGDKFSMIVNDKKEKTFTITNSMTLRELAAQVQREMGTAGTASVVMGPKGWRIDMDPKRGNRVEVFAGSVKGNALDDLGLPEGVARKIGTSKDSKRPAFVSGVVGGQTVSRGDGVNGIFRGAKGINAKAIAALDFDPTLKVDDKTLAKAATDALESSMRKVRLAFRQVNGELDAQTGGLPKAVFTPREAARMAQYQDALTKLQGGPTTSMLLGGF